jgi:hypothetical protein
MFNWVYSRPWLFPVTATAVLFVLIITGLIFKPKPTVITKTEQRVEAKSQETTQHQVNTELVRAFETLAQQNQELQQRLNKVERKESDTNTRTIERIERYLPTGGQSGNPAPVIVVPGADASQVPVAVPAQPSRDPIEIITRTIEAIDKSRTSSETMTDTSSKTEVKVDATEKTNVVTKEDTRIGTSTSTTTTAKTETRVEEPKAAEDGRALGAGVTSAGTPFLSYDITQFQLGPKVLGIGKLGAGLFVTKKISGDGQIDGGPQANYSKGRWMIMGGYQIREKAPIVGVGIKF